MAVAVIAMVLLLALASAVIAVIVGVLLTARRRAAAARPQLAAPTQAAAQIAAQLDVLDQSFAAGQLSQADYAAERNRPLGLPAPRTTLTPWLHQLGCSNAHHCRSAPGGSSPGP